MLKSHLKIKISQQIKELVILGSVSFLILCSYFILYRILDQKILSHNSWDSYTVQAMQWWQGKIALDQDYPHLELAHYKDKLLVSFPPFPTIVMFFLIPFFGEETPSNFISSMFSIGSFFVLYMVCRRKAQVFPSLFWAGFTVFGGNLLWISLSGGVWFIAQSASFFFSCLTLLCITSKTPRYWYQAFFFWAISIGCRPLQIVYFPLLYLVLLQSLQARKKYDHEVHMIRESIMYVLPAGIIGSVYGMYNFIRFDSFFEFGHKYLPEHMQDSSGQFHFSFVSENLRNIFKLPEIHKETGISFPKFNGFLFVLGNPLFLVLLSKIKEIFRTRERMITLVLICLLIIHTIAFLFHRTMGAWQFGSRFFVDMLPYVFFLIYRISLKIKPAEIVLGVFAVLFNIYGALWLFLNWQE